MRKPLSWILAAVVTVFTAFLMGACNSSAKKTKADAAEVPSATVAVVKRGNISHTLSLAGQFQPYQVVDVHPKVTGFMRKIDVDIGDRVREGQVLAVLEVPELKAQLEGAGFEMRQAKDEIGRAQHEISRAEAIHAAEHANYQRLLDTSKAQPGLVAQQELDDAQSKDLSSEAQVDAARSAADAAHEHAEAARANNDRVQALQDYTSVVAPLDGVVIWRYADTGALIQSGTTSNEQALPIVKLAQSGLLRLRMPIPEDDVKYVKVGDPMQIRIDALDRSITGTIVRFTRNVNFDTRTMETEVDVENKDLSIDPGMYANTTLELARAENVMTIPVEALVLKGNESMVYTVDANNRVHIVNVEVGIQGSRLAEIKNELQPGDRVIVGGQEKYSEGEAVTPIPTNTPGSDEKRESGGVIDLKADDKGGGPQ